MKRINKTLKYILVNIVAIILASPTLCAQNTSNEAIKAYQNESYKEAAELFENEVKNQKEKGTESAELYYNLGNAYFRDNEIAKAILNYERAILINPGDRDTRHNLEYVRTKTEDKIVGIDTFFMQSWFDSVQNLQSSNAWAKLSIILFLLLISSLSIFFFTRHASTKKIVFYAGIASLTLLIISNIFSYRLKNKISDRNKGIIMVGSAPVTNSPDNNSKELFILHSGTKVTINKVDGSWMEIEIDNGSVGWLDKDKLEII